MSPIAAGTGKPAHSAVLRHKLWLMGQPLRTVFARFWARSDLDRLAPELLIVLHQIMRASVPILQAAQGRASELASVDPVCARLSAYLLTHIDDERDHDRWMLDDLAAAGFDEAGVLDRIPSQHIAAAAGAQYYWALHHHPVAVLGYIAVLEGTPPSAARLDELRRRSGLPADAFRTLHKHSALDPDHSRELDAQIDALPLQPAHARLIGLSIAHTAAELALAIDQLLASA